MLIPLVMPSDVIGSEDCFRHSCPFLILQHLGLLLNSDAAEARCAGRLVRSCISSGFWRISGCMIPLSLLQWDWLMVKQDDVGEVHFLPSFLLPGR